MPSSSGPKTLGKENLVFALDAADKKNSMLPFSTFLNMSSWGLGSGGTGPYGQNGGTDENERVNGTDPWGNSAIVWESRPVGNTADDGGWGTGYYSIDRTKLYRWSVWVKRTSNSTGGINYLGLYGDTGIDRLDGGETNYNPYWECINISGYTKDVWYLLVGHCYPYGTSGIANNKHPDSGRYTIDGRNGDINYCNIGGDVKWRSDSTGGYHRVYHYYCPDNTSRLQWYDPRLEVCDGTQPTIQDLLRSPATYGRSLIGANKGNLVNGTLVSRDNRGTFIFDGTNDNIQLGNASDLITSNQSSITINSWIKPYSVGSYNKIFFTGNAGTTSITGIYFSIGPYPYGLYLGIITNNGGNAATYPSYISTTQYSNVCGTYDGSNIKLYLNGVLVATQAHTGNIINSGIARISGYDNNAETWWGEIAQFQIHSTALTAAEVLTNYNQNKTRFNLN